LHLLIALFIVLVSSNVDTVSSLLTLTEQDISTLVDTSHGKHLKLHKGAKGLIHLLIDYIRNLQDDDGFNSLEDYRKLDCDGFEFSHLNTPITPSDFPSPINLPPPFKSPVPLMPSERQNAIELFFLPSSGTLPSSRP
jgi:hypothetical protein